MKIVVPGEMIADKPIQLAYTFVEDNKTFSTISAIQSDDGRLVPLRGPYEPLADDFVVGVVVDVKFAGYVIELNSPYSGFLSSRDTDSQFIRGDIIYASILSVDEVKNITLTDARKLKGGRIASFPAVKIPRLIGKRNSMINMIRAACGCDIIVGRNGIVWLGENGDLELATNVMHIIESEAHIPGLTDRIAGFLKEKTGKDFASAQFDSTEESRPPRSHSFDRGGRDSGRPERRRFGSHRREGLGAKEGEL